MEDASNKESYGRQREYLLGEELQSTMNYPFRSAAIDFMLGKLDPEGFRAKLMSLKENYPRDNFYGALNVIGSHDPGADPHYAGRGPGGAEAYRASAGAVPSGG